MLSIIGDKKISDEGAIMGQIVCFCDIPHAGLPLHMAKYSHFGISFLKSFLVTKGANPVFFVVRDSVVPGICAVPTGSGSNYLRYDVSRADLFDKGALQSAGLKARARTGRNQNGARIEKLALRATRARHTRCAAPSKVNSLR